MIACKYHQKNYNIFHCNLQKEKIISRKESKTINNREPIEADFKHDGFTPDIALHVYTFLPVSEVLRALPCVSKLFQQNCQSFEQFLALELLQQRSRATQSQIPLQSRLAEEEHEENCKTADKICFRFNFVHLGAVLAPIGIELVAPKGSPWHDTLMGAYSTVVYIALGVVAYRFLSACCNNRQSRQKHYLEKQIKNLAKLSIIVESKNHGTRNNNRGENQQRNSGTELSAVCAEEKSNAFSYQLRPNVRFDS